jgi:hypothetical protein
MATLSGVRRIAGARQASAAPRLRGLATAVVHRWTDRRDNGWLAVIAVPLAMTSAALVGAWWTWPMLLAGSWACGRDWRWSWLLALELGFVGWQWALDGASALANAPTDLLLIGAIWAAFPAALAVAGHRTRRRQRDRAPEGSSPR